MLDPTLIVDPRFEILETLGQGAFVTTYLALDRRTGERCVIKTMSLRQIYSKQMHERLEREARALAQLRHPGIPRLVGLFRREVEHDTYLSLVRKHVPGTSLAHLVAEGRRFSEAQAIAVTEAVAEILEYMHALAPPVLHLGIKPSNILLTAEGQVFLIDFGAVRDEVQREHARDDGGWARDTSGYMPIEQFEGRAVPASDIYSLGASLIHALSGRQPWQLAHEGLRIELRSHVDVTDSFARVLARAVERDAGDRYRTAAALRKDLEPFVPMPMPEPEPTPTPAPPIRRATARHPGLGPTLAAFACLAGATYWLARLERPTKTQSLVPLATAPAAPPETLQMPAQPTSRPQPRTPRPQPTHAPTPTPVLPEDVSAMVVALERPDFIVYHFRGALGHVQAMDVDTGPGSVWIGMDRGLLRHDLQTGTWKLYGSAAGIPGERVTKIAVAGKKIAADTARHTEPGRSTSTGSYLFDPDEGTWTPVGESVWDLTWDGERLWLGKRDGAEARNLVTGERELLRPARDGLLHGSVSAIARSGDVMFFAMHGDYVKATQDFKGGGVTLWDLRTDRFASYSSELARSYSCGLAVDAREAWVAHWDEERGLSVLDRTTGLWSIVRRSEDGLDVGGVSLALDGNTLWVAQQVGLLRLDRSTRRAVLYREQDGLPGHIIGGLAVGGDAVWASAYSNDSQGVRSAGLVRLPRAPGAGQ